MEDVGNFGRISRVLNRHPPFSYRHKLLLGAVGGCRVHRFFHARREKQHVNRTNQWAPMTANQNYTTQKSVTRGCGCGQKWASPFRLVASLANHKCFFLERNQSQHSTETIHCGSRQCAKPMRIRTKMAEPGPPVATNGRSLLWLTAIPPSRKLFSFVQWPITSRRLGALCWSTVVSFRSDQQATILEAVW